MSRLFWFLFTCLDTIFLYICTGCQCLMLAIVYRLFGVYLRSLKVHLTYQCYSNSAAFWRRLIPSTMLCTVFATNYGHLCPSGMISWFAAVSAVVPNLSVLFPALAVADGCVSPTHHLKRLKHFGRLKSIFKMFMTCQFLPNPLFLHVLIQILYAPKWKII